MTDPSPKQQRAGGVLMAGIAVASGFSASFAGIPAVLGAVLCGLASIVLFSVSARG